MACLQMLSGRQTQDLAGDQTLIRACLSIQPPDEPKHAVTMSSVWI